MNMKMRSQSALFAVVQAPGRTTMRSAMLVLIGVALSAQVGSKAASGGSGATHIPAARVSEAFAKGVPLLETGLYKIHASRREAPGMAEVHVKDTDIVYVLEGTATLVTGGEVVGGETTATDEIRGASIRGGRPQRLVRGDVFVVPNGVPHQFTEVQGPFLYYVVKATAGGGTE